MCPKTGKETARTAFPYGLMGKNENKKAIARHFVPVFMPALWHWDRSIFLPVGTAASCNTDRTLSGRDQGYCH